MIDRNKLQKIKLFMDGLMDVMLSKPVDRQKMADSFYCRGRRVGRELSISLNEQHI